jgi:dihydrolipoamide dehydrogenase
MNYDAVIIGSGPGGYETALRVAALKGRAMVIEKGALGGVCTNRGCIPTKSLAATCDILEDIRRGNEFGIEVAGPMLRSSDLFMRRDRVSMTLRKGVEKLLTDAGVDVAYASASLVSPTEVDVGGRKIQGRNIVIATGSEPLGLPNIPLDNDYVVSGDYAASMSVLPSSVVIIGGGFIGCEYASIYSRLGCKVTLVEALPSILAQEDQDISSTLQKMLSKSVDVMTNTKVESVDRASKTVRVHGKDVPADMVLMAVGRRPVIPEGLERVGVQADRAGIRVDRFMRTNKDGIYAVGDVTPAPRLAHVAYAQAETAASNIMGHNVQVDLTKVPWCVFTSPQIARIGLTEQEARSSGIAVLVGRADYLANGKARCMGERNGFCKLIAERKTGLILGVHIIGAHASDLIGEASLALKMGLTISDVAGAIHPHPTLTELFKEACKVAK